MLPQPAGKGVRRRLHDLDANRIISIPSD